MSDSVYLDTSFIYALIDQGDPGYRDAAALYSEYEGAFTLSSYVFVETMSLITKRFGKHQAMAAGSWIERSKRTSILHPDADEFRRAWTLFLERPDSAFDVVDALSFIVMGNSGIETAFTLDRHFAQMGFRVLPGGDGRRQK